MKDRAMDDSISQLWSRYRALDPQADETPPIAYYFCDNPAEADLCADLVVQGTKRATAAALAELELAGQPLPKVGDMAIVTNWSGQARAVIRTQRVEVRRLGHIDAEFAATEGEGDGSLAWWRQAHLAYYQRVLAGTPHRVDEDLLIACEYFDCLLIA